MSDPFDITLERKLESNGDGAAAGVSEVRRIELITGAGRRRRWSKADKARIVVESLAARLRSASGRRAAAPAFRRDGSL